MGTCLSNDLRRRVVGTVESGASCHEAAARFGVGVSSAIRWVRAWRDTGSVSAKSQGGDRRSARIEAHGAFLLAAVGRRVDITLAELQALLREQGAPVGIGTLWRFFDRHGISFKKNRARRRTGAS